MRNPLRTETSANLGLLAARLPMGAFFLIAGAQKLHGGVSNYAHKHIGMVPSYVPHNWADGYVHAVPFLQAIVGLMLVIGFLARLGAFVGTLMVVIFIVGATGLMAEDLPFTPNLIYAGILLMVFLVGPGRWSADGMLFGRRNG